MTTATVLAQIILFCWFFGCICTYKLGKYVLVDDGDQGHKVTTHVLTGYTCLDCGESVILSRSDETVIIEAHNYL